ncbi:MAG: beta-galactosidase, partial [Nonlabens sp.]|nr:beta-galactosidase [Nonlabens sp.]
MNTVQQFKNIVLIALALISFQAIAGTEPALRTKTNINENWSYLENATKSLSDANAQKTWESLSLPHTWNALDATDLNPGYRRDASWYKKELVLENVSKETVYKLYFEGVNITSDVYLNGIRVGGHIGGYIGFEIDITAGIKKGKNEIMVRVDNGLNLEVIPSQKSDFFIFGGITRDVWLLTLPMQHIKSVKIVTPKVSNASATVSATISLTDKESNQKVEAFIVDPKNKIIAQKTVNVKDGNAVIKFDNISNPMLWDTDSPNLYTLKLVVNSKNGKDIVEERFGLRWFEFKDHGAFFLNGKRLLLRGTHRHEEHAGVGAAMSNEQHRADMELIKSMGTNFVRLAHYPQDPEVYKACDELGLIVWDELPWCRGGLGNEPWKENTRTMLKEIINQNYNHPSVVFWSLGNEMYWLPDFEGGDDTAKMNVFLKELNDIAHDMDPGRVTAIRKYYEGAEIVDVFSPSIWSGW